MISNRQGGRRRGRGGQRGQNLGGNRQDNRQRGNAAQLLEKYKNMARDAQLGGDRVQSEYFLQFADHYFRVLNENRARFEDQRKQHSEDSSDDNENEEGVAEAPQDKRGESDSRRKRAPARDRSKRNGAPAANEGGEKDEERIAVDVLPPSIVGEADDGDSAEEAPKPRRRARRPRGEDGEPEVAPAA